MAEERSPQQDRIDAALRDLASMNASKRRDAAYFMGEVAYEDSIPTLVELYQNDKNPGVRRAAAYALGQFRAVEVAMGRGEEATVMALLRGVENAGELGRRAPTGARVRLILSLILSLVFMAVLFLFQNELSGMALGGSTDRSALLADVRGYFSRVRDDTQTLQTEYLNVLASQQLGCVSFFNAMAPYTLDRRDAAAYRDITAVVADINQVNNLIQEARRPYDEACAGDTASFGPQQANEVYRTLIPIFESNSGLLARIEVALTAAEANTTPPTTVPPTAIPPTAVPPTSIPPTSAQAEAATQDSSAQAAPTQPPPATTIDTEAILPPLYNIVDAMIGTRGSATLLVQYWEDVGNTGETAGCSIPTVPDTPEEVNIDPSDLSASPELARAVDLINSGLTAIRDGWVDFQFACNSRNLMGELPSKLATARAAQSAFGAARTLLDAVRDPNLLLTPATGATPTTGA
ncbi:MAG: HEAT repeat domain-containing protein [Chloroflexi bacterium]|nr:HEAT repeat domain-containing protein [Chloroflexota bacterium]